MANSSKNRKEETNTTDKWRPRWTKFRDRALAVKRLGIRKTSAWVKQSAIFLGLRAKDLELSEKEDISGYVRQTEKKIESLPENYRSRFDFEALPPADQYIEYEARLAKINNVYEAWKERPGIAMAIVGEKGSGKATLLALLESDQRLEAFLAHLHFEHTIWNEEQLLQQFQRHFSGASFSSLEEAIKFLQADDTPSVIVLENIQNAFIRNINGYAAIETLLYLIAETSQHIFWLVSCSRYTWMFMQIAFKIGEYFSEVIATDELEEEQIQQLIMGRHEPSGKKLVFNKSDKDVQERSYRKLMDDEEKAQAYLKDKYFSELAEFSDGNASIAMIFWMRSITKIDEQQCQIAPLDEVPLKTIETLDPDALFILASLVLHDYLSGKELTQAQNNSMQNSQKILRSLSRRGMIVRKEEVFVLNQLIYRQVIEALKDRNIIHFK